MHTLHDQAGIIITKLFEDTYKVLIDPSELITLQTAVTEVAFNDTTKIDHVGLFRTQGCEVVEDNTTDDDYYASMVLGHRIVSPTQLQEDTPEINIYRAEELQLPASDIATILFNRGIVSFVDIKDTIKLNTDILEYKSILERIRARSPAYESPNEDDLNAFYKTQSLVEPIADMHDAYGYCNADLLDLLSLVGARASGFGKGNMYKGVAKIDGSSETSEITNMHQLPGSGGGYDFR